MPGNFEDSGEVVPAAGLTTGDQGGRRRADVTAVDLGYTGRRAKPDPQEEPAEEQADDAEYYSSNGNYWEASYSETPTGYPGWAEADERHGDRSWRGREDTGGW